MDEAVEIRRGKLKRLDTDEVAEKLSPDEVEEFRDAFEVVFHVCLRSFFGICLCLNKVIYKYDYVDLEEIVDRTQTSVDCLMSPPSFPARRLTQYLFSFF